MELLNRVSSRFLQACYPPSQAYLLPKANVIRTWPGFVDLIDADETRRVKREDFKELLQDMEQRINAYQASRKAQILEVSPQPSSSKSAAIITPDPISLARCVSACSKCNDVLVGWPGVVTHPCLESFQLRPGVCVSVPASPAPNKIASENACTLIKLAGRDPTTTTIEEMDNLDVWYTCTQCRTSGGFYLSHTWRCMVSMFFVCLNTRADFHGPASPYANRTHSPQWP